MAFFGVCGHGRNKKDRTPLGSGIIGSQPWGVHWIHLGTFTKIPHLGPILREPSVTGLGAVWVLGLFYSPSPKAMQTCSVAGILFKEEAINHDNHGSLVTHSQA